MIWSCHVFFVLHSYPNSIFSLVMCDVFLFLFWNTLSLCLSKLCYIQKNDLIKTVYKQNLHIFHDIYLKISNRIYPDYLFKKIETNTNLVEKAVEVDVNTFTSERVKEDVFSVAISQTQDVAHHGHHSSRAAVRRTTAVPVNTMNISPDSLKQTF